MRCSRVTSRRPLALAGGVHRLTPPHSDNVPACSSVARRPRPHLRPGRERLDEPHKDGAAMHVLTNLSLKTYHRCHHPSPRRPCRPSTIPLHRQRQDVHVAGTTCVSEVAAAIRVATITTSTLPFCQRPSLVDSSRIWRVCSSFSHFSTPTLSPSLSSYHHFLPVFSPSCSRYIQLFLAPVTIIKM
jgi:hypothetical protein